MRVEQEDQRAVGLSPADVHRGAHVTMIINAIVASLPEATSGDAGQAKYTVGLPGVPGTARPYEQMASQPQIRKEIDDSIHCALLGDGPSARRAAELYEVLEEFEMAAAWWTKAVDLGDADAISYVKHFLQP